MLADLTEGALSPAWPNHSSPTFSLKKSNPMTQFFTTSLWRMALSLSIVLLFAPRLFSQCNPDITPPVAVCDEFTSVSLGADGTATVMAATFDDGSYDDCCLGAFQIRRQTDGPCDGDNTLDDFGPTITFCCAEVGTPIFVALQVNDCAGNSSLCMIEVNITDKIKAGYSMNKTFAQVHYPDNNGSWCKYKDKIVYHGSYGIFAYDMNSEKVIPLALDARDNSVVYRNPTTVDTGTLFLKGLLSESGATGADGPTYSIDASNLL